MVIHGLESPIITCSIFLRLKEGVGFSYLSDTLVFKFLEGCILLFKMYFVQNLLRYKY